MFTYAATEITGFPAFIFILLVLSIIASIFALFAAPFFVIGAVLRRQAEDFVKKRQSTVVAQYDPPRDFSPAEVGFLYDLVCGEKEIQATLFDLEQRGVVTFEAKDSVRIVDQAAFSDLRVYEKIALRLHAVNIEVVEPPEKLQVNVMNQAYSREFYIAMPRKKFKVHFTMAVQKSLNAKGIHTKGYTQSFVQKVLLLGFTIGWWPLITAAFPINSNGVNYPAWSAQSIGGAFGFVFVAGLLMWPFYYLLAYVLLKVYTKIAGRAWLSNKQIRALWPELEGYRLFLKTVDLDNIQYESENAKLGIVTKTLPYAMVFNLETRWQARLKD